MSIDIDPLELGFHRPFTSEVSQILKIRNPNQTPVAFKVKTTAPKQYCVRPNSGKIEPGKEVEVIVLLQAMKVDLPPEVKCKDKFLVQSVAVTGDNEASIGGPTWQSVDDADKSAIQEKKIRVAYLAPLLGPPAKTGSTPIKNNPNGVGSNESDGASPANNAYRSPSPEATYTPDSRTTNRQTFGISGSFDPGSSPQNPSSSTSVAPTYDEILAKLSKAEEIVANYAQDDGLRRRKVSSENSSNETLMKLEHTIQHGSQGVPLQIVAVLCFTSFLLAYLLF